MASIKDEIRNAFKNGGALNQLIMINIGVFVLFYLLKVIGGLFQVNLAQGFIDWTALPTNLSVLITRPWTFITYMFLHEGFTHILFNMLILFFSGRVFLEYMGGRKLLSLYLLGGLIGGVLYVISYNVFPVFSEIVAIADNRGASAGVMAILIGAATYAPRYPVRLFFVLNIEFRWVAVFVLLLDFINLGDGNNPGGMIAHFGGAGFGYYAVSQYKNGRDITEGFNKFMDNIVNWFKPKPKIRKVYSKKTNNNDDEFKAQKTQNQHRMNEILDKINRSGYDSLSKDEKDYLFKIGKD